MPKSYLITPPLWLVRDEASVRRHVHSDDYFGTIATVLSLLRQQIKKDGAKNAALLEKTLNNLENDLVFLQKDYRISQRPARTARSRRAARSTSSPASRIKR
jgi:hypothetical protein